ncbi:MAG: copper homeostasis protein [Planctomycetota bacterium]|jgi:copper homeostasis protein
MSPLDSSPTEPPILLEIVVQSMADARAAEAGGAHRLELCVGLNDGGLTPPATLVEAVVAAVAVPVNVLIRPRGGDFVLDDEELELMCADVRASRAAGAAGVVIGALTPEGDVDCARMGKLIAAARPLEVTFHRAFDHTRDPLAAFSVLTELGVDRLLTSGQRASAPEGSALIAKLVAMSSAREPAQPLVMAGGGVRPANVAELVETTSVREVHSSASAEHPSPARHVNESVPLGPTHASRRHGVDMQVVRDLMVALQK